MVAGLVLRQRMRYRRRTATVRPGSIELEPLRLAEAFSGMLSWVEFPAKEKYALR